MLLTYKTALSSCVDIVLKPEDNNRLQALCGSCNDNINLLEKHFQVDINQRGFNFQIIGKPANIDAASKLLQKLYAEGAPITAESIFLNLKESKGGQNPIAVNNRQFKIKARGKNQELYLQNIDANDINFSIGPAGTGKTFLAVAMATRALENDEVERLIFVRPAVEAGEKLGFLPGDMEEKVLPYLRPLYDSLYSLIGFDKATKLIKDNVIEIAPIAYMRGRTLNNAYIILDEAQNTTVEQMKMFLTRIGFGSTAIITGDITQIDLPRGIESGLAHSMRILQNIPGISFSYFQAEDAVRHPLVQQIIKAYEKRK